MKHQEIITQLTLAQKCSLLSGKDTWSTRSFEDAGVPAMILSDGPSGVRRQLGAGDQLGLHQSEKATCFPSASTVANSWDINLAEKVGLSLGLEAAVQDVDCLLGPGLNIKRSPLCGRNFEYFSEDPYLAGKLAAGYIRGIQSQGVAACPKHFAVNNQELHRMANDSVVDERTLRELYLTNFEIAVKEGRPKTLMSAYNALNGTYVNENPYLLQEILRDEWGFQGAVVTDWGGSNDFVEGIRAGSNLEMPGTGDDSACQLYEAVKNGKISEAEVDCRVDELLDVILWATAREKQSVDMDHQNAIALEAAERSAVLLKNDGKLLPLQKDAKLAIIGDFAQTPRYQGAGSSLVNTVRLSKTLECVKNIFEQPVTFAKGFVRKDVWDESLAVQAEGAAKNADVAIVYLGLPEVFEAEGLDRSQMRIPGNQVKLLERVADANRNTVVVFSGGSAVEMPWLGRCKALLWAGLGGQAGAEAVLRVLSGEVNPGGKLAETFPVRYEDLPVSRYFPGKQRTSEYREGLFVGYRYSETANTDVTFPFGFGISYTTFAYANAEATPQSVSFDLTNTGNCAGDEIAQVYVALPGGQVLRPAKELKGFARFHLKAKETRRVTIPLDDKAFRYFSTETGGFETEGGNWSVMVGASVRDIRLTAQVQVVGSAAKIPEAAKGTLRPGDLMAVTDEAFAKLLGRPISKAARGIHAPLEMNDPIDALVRAKNPVARLVVKFLLSKREKSIAAGKPDLNILFITNMPFRGIAKMMGGMVTMKMAEDLVFLANGHWHRGLGRLIRDFFKKPCLKKLQEAQDRWPIHGKTLN